MVEEAAETVVSEDKVRCRGDSSGGGGGVGGGEMLERLELTAESLSLSSSTGRRPGAETLLFAVESLYSKLKSDLGTKYHCYINFLGLYCNKSFSVLESGHSTEQTMVMRGTNGTGLESSVIISTHRHQQAYFLKRAHHQQFQFSFQNKK